MPTPLRVLLVEDNADDAALIVRQLARADFDLASRRVEDAGGLADALASEWDLVLADYNLPGFSGLDALAMIVSRDIDVPLVLVSGAIDVSTALEAMKAGAKDFVLKDDTQRLPSVIRRELEEAAQRARRRVAEAQRDLALRELREANEQLAAFARFTDFPLEGRTVQQLLDALLFRLAGIVHADGATVLLLEDGFLVTRGAIGPSQGHASHVPLGSGFAGTIAAENRAVYVRDAAGDGLSSRSTRETGIRSMLGVPMHDAGAVTGVLRVDWLALYDPPEWLPSLLEIAADRCAMAIENVRFYEREHHIADTLQQALLSISTDLAGIEMGHFYGSATVETLVGGDFYDVFETVPGTVAFSVGDVSGKGLGAAGVTALVKNTMRAHAIDGDPPDVVMSKTNRAVGRFTALDAFVTGVFGTLDTGDGTMRYSMAGHPPPVVVGPSGARQLALGGPLLGAFDDSAYEVMETSLRPGESIVLFTDGVTEARSAAGVFYGEARLLAFLESLARLDPRGIAARLHEEIIEFSAGRLRDDAAVLVLRPRQTKEPAPVHRDGP